ncbi:hypothetical protein HPB47_015252, partial [Ixodes persulcatus]
TAAYPQIEAKLPECIEEKRGRSHAISTEMAQIEALRLAREDDIPRNQFRASRWWFYRFMKHQGFFIRRRTTLCQRLPDAYEEELVNFQRYVIELQKYGRTLPTDLPSGIVVRVEDNSWMNSHLVVDWLKTMWENRPGTMLARRSTIVLDAFWEHNTKNVKTRLADLMTNLIMILRGTTPMLQPMDVCLNKPFKLHVKLMHTEWIAEEEYNITPTARICKADIQYFESGRRMEGDSCCDDSQEFQEVLHH